MTYDHWAAVSSSLRQKLLIPLTESLGTTTVVRIEADGNKTVITMGGASSDTNTNFRFCQECLDWVETRLVSTNSMASLWCSLEISNIRFEIFSFCLNKLLPSFSSNISVLVCREAY